MDVKVENDNSKSVLFIRMLRVFLKINNLNKLQINPIVNNFINII
jgi:hypothetical protein